LAQKYNKIECKCFSTNVFNPNDDVERGCLQKSDFLETVYLPFEMVKLPCPKNYDAVLRNYYGNWNDFVMGTAYHSNVFYDTNKSYKEYVNHTVN
jgi:lipopolysaccharide cholinephosphotransferase